MAKTKIKPDIRTPKDIEDARVSLFLEYLEKVNWLTKFMPTIEDYIEQRIDTYHAIMYKMATSAKQPNSVTNKMLLGESVSEKEINKYVSKIEMAKLTSDPIEYFTYHYVIRFIAVTSIIARFENYLDFDMDGSVKSKDLKKEKSDFAAIEKQVQTQLAKLAYWEQSSKYIEKILKNNNEDVEEFCEFLPLLETKKYELQFCFEER